MGLMVQGELGALIGPSVGQQDCPRFQFESLNFLFGQLKHLIGPREQNLALLEVLFVSPHLSVCPLASPPVPQDVIRAAGCLGGNRPPSSLYLTDLAHNSRLAQWLR